MALEKKALAIITGSGGTDNHLGLMSAQQHSVQVPGHSGSHVHM